MSHFRLLKDPGNYSATDWDLLADEQARQHWLGHFGRQFDLTLTYAQARYGRAARGRIDAARAKFAQAIESLRADPTCLPGGTLTLIDLDRLRERIMNAHGLRDPFAPVKARQTEAAVELFAQVVRGTHAMDDEEKWLHLITGIFAGNVFDLGCMDTAELAEGDPDFYAAVGEVRPRPWLIDDYDALAAELISGPPAPWAKAVIFVDNAGADFVLGVMPLARELALAGTQIVLAANEGPALNDITVGETVATVQTLAVDDPDLAALIQAGLFEVVSTGSGIPLLDLSDVSDELNAACEGADAVVLEGMGRAIESNLDAAFTVDCIRLALLKSPEVAARLGGEPYDCVCSYVPGDGGAGDS